METSILMQVSQEFQGFSAADGLTVVTLAIPEGILSVDNSLVLAILVRTLPKKQQKKALMSAFSEPSFSALCCRFFYPITGEAAQAGRPCLPAYLFYRHQTPAGGLSY